MITRCALLVIAIVATSCAPVAKISKDQSTEPRMDQAEVSNFVEFAEELSKWATNKETQPPTEFDLPRLKKVALQFRKWGTQHKLPGTKKGEEGEVRVCPLNEQARTEWLTDEMRGDIANYKDAYLCIVQTPERTLWYLICSTETNITLVGSYIEVEDGCKKLESPTGILSEPTKQ